MILYDYLKRMEGLNKWFINQVKCICLPGNIPVRNLCADNKTYSAECDIIFRKETNIRMLPRRQGGGGGECLLPVPFFIEEENGDLSYKARHISDHFFSFFSDFFEPTKLSIELIFHVWYHQGTS